MKKVYFFATAGLILLLSFSANPPQGRTGAPGESLCNASGCHSTINPAIEGDIELMGINQAISPGESYNLNLKFTPLSGNPKKLGFQMTALDREDQAAGTMSSPGPNTTLSFSAGRSYFEHNPASAFIGSDPIEHNVNWKLADAVESDSIIFYIAANFANGDGGNSGDRIQVFRKAFALNLEKGLEVSISQTDLSCPAAMDAQVSLNISGGLAPYTILWSTGDTSAILKSLGPGSYSFTVTDKNKAVQTGVVEISSEGVDKTAPEIQCLKDSFFISTCLPFSYPFPTATDNCGEVLVRLVSGQGPNTAYPIGISKDIYEAIDSGGNIARCTITVVNTASPDAIVEIMHPKCPEDSLGTVKVLLNGMQLSFTLDGKSPVSFPANLAAGQYLLEYEDTNACKHTKTIEIIRPKLLKFDSIAIVPSKTNQSGDGSISVLVSGGTPPYKFEWYTEDELFATTQNLSLLFPGNYLLLLKDSRGCQLATDSIRIDFLTANENISSEKYLNLYPTIANNYINLSISSSTEEITHIEIFDYRGKKHLTKPHTESNSIGINVGMLPPGIYLLRMSLKSGESFLKKFIKE